MDSTATVKVFFKSLCVGAKGSAAGPLAEVHLLCALIKIAFLKIVDVDL
jgi:hypothetical protein